MTKLILQIFEALKAHTILRWTSLMVFTVILVLLTVGQSYKEDISDFLPLENEQQKAFMEYQNSSSARRIYVIFQAPSNSCQPAIPQRVCNIHPIVSGSHSTARVSSVRSSYTSDSSCY